MRYDRARTSLDRHATYPPLSSSIRAIILELAEHGGSGGTVTAVAFRWWPPLRHGGAVASPGLTHTYGDNAPLQVSRRAFGGRPARPNRIIRTLISGQQADGRSA